MPDLIELLPAGPRIEGRDGRVWRLDDPQRVIAAFARRGSDLPVDVEHASHVKGARGEPAPAVGWIKGLEVRDGAVWGRVNWTDAGRDLIQTQAYRYVSPVFTHAADGRVGQLVSVALTNIPNLHLAALNREGTNKENVMDPAVLEALGLAPNASAADAVVAINRLREERALALNRAEAPDPDKFVPRETHELALNRVRALEEAEAARLEAEITEAVDAAVEAGKVAPANRDFYLAACRAEGGLERFRAAMENAPVVVSEAPGGASAPAAQTSGGTAGAARLGEEELAVCRQLGISPEEFVAARAASEADKE